MIEFIFAESQKVSPEKGYVVIVPKGIASKEELLNVLHELLSFPDYDGRNWDALHELLRDFWWITDKEINIIHCEIPTIGVEDAKTYLEILNDSIKTWHEDVVQRDENTPWAEHILHVYFPENDKLAIESIIGGCK